VKYYKIIAENRTHCGYKFTEGLNTDPLPWNPDVNCKPGGFYFSDAENICGYVNYGPWICKIEVPEDVEIAKKKTKYKAHEIILGKFKDLRKIKTWKWMIKQGVNIHADDDFALHYAARIGYLELVKFLVEQGANIHADNDLALRWAAEKGHLDIVKFLVEQGANIHADNNSALRWAAHYGHLDVVKFLVKNGADVHACENWALHWAAFCGHLDVVKYLENLEIQ
jgi:hypothetical protein